MILTLTNNLKMKKIEIDSIINGKILKKKAKEVYVDLSPYGVGRLYGIYYLRNKSLIDKLNEGDDVVVKIVGLDDGYGNLEVEFQDLHYINNWQKIKELMNNKEILELEIKEANKGGLIVELEGIKGFIPVSQLAPENYPRVNDNDKKRILEHLNKFVGSKMKLRIIAVDPSVNKLIFSEKAAKLEEYQKILSQFKVNDMIEVEILGTSPFGVFVKVNDNPQIDGLIHITEIPEKYKNLEESFKKGEKIKARIIKIENDRINLSLLEDPWVKFINEYKEGDLVEGLVLEKNDDIFAVIAVGEIKGILLDNLDKVEAGNKYQFKINKIELKEKKLIFDFHG